MDGDHAGGGERRPQGQRKKQKALPHLMCPNMGTGGTPPSAVPG